MRTSPIAATFAMFFAGCGTATITGGTPSPCDDHTCPADATCDDSSGSAVCSCLAGFEDPAGGAAACVDIDECVAGMDACDPLAGCTNTEGSYTCAACPAGYDDVNGDGTECDDIDECLAGTDACDANAACTNAAGSYICMCVPGYDGDGYTCIMNGACTPGAGDCHALATCTDVGDGVTVCQCPVGYTGDGVAACGDIDECLAGTDNCDALADCADIDGGFDCICPSGYADPNGDGTLCIDYDECAGEGSGHNCDAVAACDNIGGSHTCTCPGGYADTNGDGSLCADIDECPLFRCDPLVSCNNLPGTFTCDPCPGGYDDVNADGTNCVDWNECSGENGGHDCDPLVACRNTAGSFTCDPCPAGYNDVNIDGTSCVDWDECAGEGDGHDCDALVACTNTAGSFLCGTCPPHYADIYGDGTLCTDYDECAGEGGGNNCDPVAACDNVDGGFTCTCPGGYTDTNDDGTLCDDINECLLSLCDPLVTCTNTTGSFTCGACPPGYADTNGDGTLCTDDDECVGEGSGNNCDPVVACNNTSGAFTCDPCPPGYDDVNGDGTSCVDWDECAGENGGHDCGAVACSNTPGSYVCLAWYGVAGSELADHATRVTDSAAGGGITGNVTLSEKPSVAVLQNGDIVVGWHETKLNYGDVFVRAWDGAAWYAFADSDTGGASPGTRCYDAKMVVDQWDHPTVSWQNDSSNRDVHLTQWDGAAWVALGGSASGGGVTNVAGVYDHDMDVDPSGYPAVVWAEGEVYVLVWDGAAWQELAGSATGSGISNNTGSSRFPRIAFDAAGYPVVAWRDQSSGSVQVYLLAWDGAAWVELDGSATDGGVSNSTAMVGSSTAPALGTDALGYPIVAWADGTSGVNEIYVKRWNGAAWTELAGSATGGGTSNSSGSSCCPTLVIDNAGYPVVVWQESPDLFLRRWTGAAWDEVGGSGNGRGLSNSYGSSYAASVAVDGDDNPVVSWLDTTSSNREIFVKRWTGSEWAPLYSSITGGGISNGNPSDSSAAVLLFDGTAPVVAWQDDADGDADIYLARQEGAGWVGLGNSMAPGGLSSNDGASTAVTFVIESTGYPVVAWSDDTSGNLEIYLRRWNGAAWEEMGGSATGGGISNDTGYSLAPSLALASDAPIIAWQNNYANSEIYLRAWDGAAWSELAGSATGVGISNSSGHTKTPSLAVDAGGQPHVAWSDSSSGIYDILVSAWDGAAWTPYASPVNDPGGSSDDFYTPDLAFDGADRPLVAFHRVRDQLFFEDNLYVYVRRWTGTGWENLDGTTTAGVVASNASQPRLALDASGQPIVAYRALANDIHEIHLRRWQTDAWVEVSGSATAGGISNSATVSHAPSVAWSANALCVAWHEAGATSNEILMRCHDE